MTKPRFEASSQLPEGVSSRGSGPLHGDLRDVLRVRGEDVNNVTDLGLGYILSAVGDDVEMAADAICMRPRPRWVIEFCGYPEMPY